MYLLNKNEGMGEENQNAHSVSIKSVIFAKIKTIGHENSLDRSQ